MQAQARRRAIPVAWLVPLLLGLLALLPRVWGLNDFLTTDEAYHWISRSERFSAAVAQGRWADTILTGHPGVTVMWLGSLGLALERWAVDMGWATVPTRLEHLAWLRLPVAMLHSLLLPLAYLLLRRLVRPAVALVAALLWATSPWLVAYGRVLHLDMLLTNFVLISMLLLLVGQQQRMAGKDQATRRGDWPWLLGSGVVCGLALLTKGPALIWLPVAGLLMFMLDLRRWILDFQRDGFSIQQLTSKILHLFLGYVAWLAVALALVGLLWPAMWSAPEVALGRYFGEILDNGGRPNGDGQFFLGVAVGDPGPLFYPLALLFRFTPLEMVGIVAGLGFTLYALRFTHRNEWWQLVTRNSQFVTLLAFAFFAAFTLLVMTLGPKKFDRYVLPIWPALLLFAAVGLVRIADRRLQIADWLRPKVSALASLIAHRSSLIALVLLCQLPILAWFHPYYLSYYNPLLGGGPVAQRNLLIGWGEGMNEVGAYLRSRPDIASGQVLSALPPTLQPFVPVPVRDVLTIDEGPANYAVVYLESLQREADPAIYARLQQTAPLHTVSIHGIDYATIYQLPRPFATPLAAQFGGGLRLWGYTLEQTPDRLVVTPAWDVRARPEADYLVFMHVLDAQGNRVAQIAVPPGGDSLPPTGAWQPGEQFGVPLPLDLPAGLPAGDYQVVLGLFDPVTGERLPLTAGPAADQTSAGPHALLVAKVTLR
jgi:4-amino-4-deoxy-L-arabinose transferase-like glycosyltransferase